MKDLIVSPSPHLRSGNSTQKIMLDVIIALLPAFVASIIVFGGRAAFLTVFCSVSCVVFEYLSRLMMKRTQTVSDLSAVVTGMLLAMNLPVTIPLWIALFGSFVAIVVVKQLFGGIGQNFANPAIAARVILLASFSGQMTRFTAPFDHSGVDAVVTATPLTQLANGGEVPTLLEMFLGAKGGCIGEVSCLALLIGGIYLVARKVISPITPVVFIGTVFLGSFLLGQNPLYQICSGGLFIGAIFMATDYATSPITKWGKFYFALGCGIITVLIRFYGGYPEGVSFAILLMNILTPQIEKLTTRTPVGVKVKDPKKLKIKKIVLRVIGIVLVILVALWTALTLFNTSSEYEENLKEALPLGDKFELTETSSEEILYAYKSESGVAIVINSQGYNKQTPIEMMVGFNPEGEVQGISIINHHETEGLGSKVFENTGFIFAAKTDPYGADVVANATFTSEGVKNGIIKATELFNSVKSEILG